MNTIAYRLFKKPQEKFNVIYFPYDGFFDHYFAQLNVNLLSHTDYRVYKYNCPESSNVIPIRNHKHIRHFKPHLVVCNHRSQLSSAINYSNTYHLPIILIDHNLTNGPNDYEILQSNRSLNSNFTIVSINDQISNAWKSKAAKYIIPYGIKHEPIDIKVGSAMLLGNASRDIKLAISNLEKSAQIEKFTSYKELQSYVSSVPICVLDDADKTKGSIAQLLSMSVGTILCTNNNSCGFVEHGINGFVYKNGHDLTRIIKGIDEQTIENITFEGYKTTAKYPLESFFDQWTLLLNQIVQSTFIKE